MSKLLRKLIIIISIIICVLFIALVISAWSLGAFSPVSLLETERGPYYFLTFVEKSRYDKIPQQLKKIRVRYSQQPIDKSMPAVLLLSDPNQGTLNNMEIRAGFILLDSTEVDSSLMLIKIKKRKVLLASIQANPSIAVFKIYPSLRDWLEKNKDTYKYVFPALEIYNNSKFSIEVPLDKISKR
jgi:hypothetical protein